MPQLAFLLACVRACLVRRSLSVSIPRFSRLLQDAHGTAVTEKRLPVSYLLRYCSSFLLLHCLLPEFSLLFITVDTVPLALSLFLYSAIIQSGLAPFFLACLHACAFSSGTGFSFASVPPPASGS